MQAKDIIAQLAVNLPKYTDKFTDEISITGLTLAGSTVTAQCATAHGLAINQQVAVIGAESPIVINSLTRSGTVGTLVTDTPHDLTEDRYNSQSVTLAGSTEAEFNGDFVLLSVPNRYTVTFAMVDAGAVTATGSPLLVNGWSNYQTFNGLHKVTAVPAADQFQYEITTAPPTNTAAGTIIARGNVRVGGSVSEERAISSYTPGKWWAFVILGDVTASKSRQIESDATDNIQRGNEYRQQVLQPFNVLVLAPASNEIAALNVRDDCETLFRALSRSLLFSKLDSGLAVGSQNPIQFVSHGSFFYNASYYAHFYSFEAVADLTFDDTVGYDEDVAFRDIDLSMYLDIGTQEDALTANINLDEV